MDNQSLKVFVRARKPSGTLKPALKFFPDEKTIGIPAYLLGRQRTSDLWKNIEPEDHCIKTNGILYHASQEETYRMTCHYVIQRALEGYSAMIMAFGPRNVGKTTTLFGVTKKHEFQFRGCAIRALETIMEYKDSKVNWDVNVDVSFAMFQKNHYLDLLKPYDNLNDIIINEERGWMTLKGLDKTTIQNFREGAECILIGNQQRYVVMDKVTPNHAVLTFYISVKKNDETGNGVTKSKVHFIDFCAPVHGPHSQISLTNNMDMMALGQVMEGHRMGVIERYMFRRSKLLLFLKDIFKFNGYLRFIAHVNNDKESLREASSSLLLASKLLKTRFKPIRNISVPDSEKIHQLERKMSNLEKELFLQDALLEKPHRHELALSKEYRDELRRQVLSYLQGTEENIDVASLSQVKMVYSLFKECLKEMMEADSKMKEMGKVSASYTKGTPPSKLEKEEKEAMSQDGVGQLLNQDIAIGPAGKGFHRGTSTANKKKDQVKTTRDSRRPGKEDGKIQVESSGSLDKDTESLHSKRNSFLSMLFLMDGKEDANKQNMTETLEKYRFDKGRKLMEEVRLIAEELQVKQKDLLSLTQKLTECRGELESLKVVLAAEQTERHVLGDNYDEEGNVVSSGKEREIVTRLKDLEQIHDRLRSRIVETKTSISMKQDLGIELRRRFEKEFLQYCLEFDKPMDFMKTFQDRLGPRSTQDGQVDDIVYQTDKFVYNEIVDRLSKFF